MFIVYETAASLIGTFAVILLIASTTHKSSNGRSTLFRAITNYVRSTYFAFTPQSFDLFGLIIFASSATLTPDVCATQASQPNDIKTSRVLEKLHTGSADRRYDTYTGMQCSVPSKPKQPECSVELRTR